MKRGISETLRKTIKEADSVYSVAKAAGVALPVVSRFVNRKRDVTLGTAEKLCEALGLRLVSGCN